MQEVEDHDSSISHSSDSGVDEVDISGSKIVSKIRKIKATTSSKTKDAVARIASRTLDKDCEIDDDVGSILDGPAFHPKPSNNSLEPEHGPLDKVKSAAKSTVKALAHPRRVLQAKAKQATAGKLSTINKPHSSSTHDAELLEAHENLHSNRADDPECRQGHAPALNRQKVQDKARIRQLEAEEESRRVAWITEHVNRVRVVPIQKRLLPLRENYHIKHKDGHISVDYARWIGHLALWYTQGFTTPYIDDFDSIPFDLRTFRSHVERLAVATIPWQVWAMDVRSVYQWQNPWRTARWLLLWSIFWYFEYIASFLWVSLIYYTIRNKINPPSLEALRASTKRIENHETAAFGFNEFVERHGDEEWLDPLIEQLGPYVQLQICDLVNLIEALANFYSWKSPGYTLRTLFFCVSCLFLGIFTDLRYALKAFWFIAGGGFFLCWPIASLYPRYRILVSPFRWAIWDIPTHAESSFIYLSQHCHESRLVMLETEQDQYAESIRRNTTSNNMRHGSDTDLSSDMDTDTDTESDSTFHSAPPSPSTRSRASLKPTLSTIPNKALLSYRCLHDHRPGRLQITPFQIQFLSSMHRDSKVPETTSDLQTNPNPQTKTTTVTSNLSTGIIRSKKTPTSALWTIPYGTLLEMRKYKRSSASNSVEKHSRSKHEGIESTLELETTDGHVYTLDLGTSRTRQRNQAFNAILGFSGAFVRWQNLQC